MASPSDVALDAGTEHNQGNADVVDHLDGGRDGLGVVGRDENHVALLRDHVFQITHLFGGIIAGVGEHQLEARSLGGFFYPAPLRDEPLDCRKAHRVAHAFARHGTGAARVLRDKRGDKDSTRLQRVSSRDLRPGDGHGLLLILVLFVLAIPGKLMES